MAISAQSTAPYCVTYGLENMGTTYYGYACEATPTTQFGIAATVGSGTQTFTSGKIKLWVAVVVVIQLMILSL